MSGAVRTLPEVLPVRPLGRPVEAVVRPPGSKSVTNRALVVAALAGGGVSRLHGPLEADDTAVMREGLRSFGVLIDDVDDPWLVLGTAGKLAAPPHPVDAAASGTTARFLTAVSVLSPGEVVVDGSRRMRERPIEDLAAALRMLGAVVETTNGAPPVRVSPGRLHGGAVEVSGATSSQFVSALLLVSPLLGEEVRVTVTGGLVSRPYVRTTLDVMAAFGADVDERPDVLVVAPTGYRTAHYEIEADASAAAYPFVAAAVTGGNVAVDGIPRASTQADLALLGVLERMGCAVDRREDRIIVRGPAGDLRAVDADMADAPDAVLALAVACLFADGPSRIRRAGTLRLKETDRLVALETEIRRLGAGAVVDGDDLVVVPGPLHGGRVETYDDHRMAMAFSLVGLRVPGVEIADPGCVAKTWPGFFDVLEAL